MYPLGYVVQVIKAGEQLSDSQRVIDLLHQVPTRPNQKCIDFAASQSEFDFDEAGDIGSAGVEDIRSQLTITIDPSGCQDVDDALTLSRLSTGGFLVGVHIADVGRFVTEGDVHDCSARRRMMSFYAATDEVHHMLPARLSEHLCSLRQGKDRCALSVYLETDDKLKVIDTKSRSLICRSLIRNDRQMSYEEAQEIISAVGHRRLPWTEGSVQTMVVYLHQIALRLRIARLREAQFCNSEPDDPFSLVECQEAHHLVEEFMIRTNSEVAWFLSAQFPESVPVRRQKSPDEDEANKWMRRHEAVTLASMYFKQFNMPMSCGPTLTDDSVGSNTISFLRPTIDDLEAAVDSGDLRKAVSLIAHESKHPHHTLAMNSWFQIQVFKVCCCGFFLLFYIMRYRNWWFAILVQ